MKFRFIRGAMVCVSLALSSMSSLAVVNLEPSDSYGWVQFTEGKPVGYIARCATEMEGDVEKVASLTLNSGKKPLPPITRFVGADYDKDMFPIRVFEWKITPAKGKNTVRMTCGSKDNININLPDVAQDDVPKFIILGDSGCKPTKQRCVDKSDGGKPKQTDDYKRSWAFPEIVEAAKSTSPEFVIHVGDYVYQGSDRPSSTGLSKTANWDLWKKDFFIPAAQLLESVPFIMTRGNHETYVSNSGLGWFILLDNELKGKGEIQGIDGLLPVDADKSLLGGSTAHSVIRDPYSFNLSKTTDIVVLDSSTTTWFQAYKNGTEDEKKAAATFAKKYLKKAEALAKGKQNWLISHVPVLSLNEDGDIFDGSYDQSALDDGNWQNVLQRNTIGVANVVKGTRQAFMRSADKAEKNAAFDTFQAFIAGDVHGMQYFKPEADSGYPLQLVIGNGGVVLDALGKDTQGSNRSSFKTTFTAITDYQAGDKTDEHWRSEPLAVEGVSWRRFGYAAYNGGKFSLYAHKTPDPGDDDYYTSMNQFEELATVEPNMGK